MDFSIRIQCFFLNVYELYMTVFILPNTLSYLAMYCNSFIFSKYFLAQYKY